MFRRWLLAVFAVAVFGAVGVYWLLRTPEPQPDRMVLRLVDYDDLVGWRENDFGASLAAFRRSCNRFSKLAADRLLIHTGIAGHVRDWMPVCEALEGVGADSSDTIRHYFENWFAPLEIANNDQPKGLFTGYYEPQLRGSQRKHGRFVTPLYALPPELVMVDLGSFRDDLRGRRIAGHVVNGRLRPFASRAEIEAGALADRGLEIMWVDDPIDAFFLHVQGSGQVVLEDGEVTRVGYAGQNGHPYFAIGRELINRGVLERRQVSLQTIRAWLEANPEQAASIMNKNRSFIFFRRLTGDGPVGAFQEPLTPRASLAVDRRYIPLGAPLWLETALPSVDTDPDKDTIPWRQLVVAQDTGGAIRGIVRGDVFFGAGGEAEALAGRLKSEGRYFVLLPRAVVERGDPWSADAPR